MAGCRSCNYYMCLAHVEANRKVKSPIPRKNLKRQGHVDAQATGASFSYVLPLGVAEEEAKRKVNENVLEICREHSEK